MDALPPHFVAIKQEIAASVPDFQARVTNAWVEILGELAQTTATIIEQGTDYIPQVNFADLKNLSASQIDSIKRKGCIAIKDVVSDDEAIAWKVSLEEYIKANPEAKGVPSDDKQFFLLYWAKAQVQARAHPNVLAAAAWLNNLYSPKSGAKLDGVDLSAPLSYADRFRIRHPGLWDAHPPHIDGGSIERWLEKSFRACFMDILNGNWRVHDPYDLEGRLDARTSLFGRANQSSVFRTFQGWLALSETSPNEGTLQVFPDVLLSNAYILLRPFFRPLVSLDSPDALDPQNWEFDISTPDFPGILKQGPGYQGPRPTTTTHPHLRLDKTMTSVPKVAPGDMVFWHCDLIHSVEVVHSGKDDSAVMYIPAVPLTPQNLAYVHRQNECFLKGTPPPDFPQDSTEVQFKGIGIPGDILVPEGRFAMGITA